jgi:hypothetical protein
MIVICEKCGVPFDDEHRWTICPHAPLEASAPDGGNYCMEHDLFYCPLHEKIEPPQPG